MNDEDVEMSEPRAGSPPRWKTVTDNLQGPAGLILACMGIVSGAYAGWQWFVPAKDLVADLVITEARLPNDNIQRARSLPTDVDADLVKSKDLLSLVPDDRARRQVIDVAKESVERQSFALHALPDFNNSFMFVDVRNEGELPLHDVTLAMRHPIEHSVTVVQADGSVKNIRATGVISLGELPPLAQIKVFAWGMAFLITTREDITISHQTGIGEIRFLTPVPQFIWGNGGVFLSFKHTTFALLAVILLTGGLALLRRRWL